MQPLTAPAPLILPDGVRIETRFVLQPSGRGDGRRVGETALDAVNS
jgi:hypothetical protein